MAEEKEGVNEEKDYERYDNVERVQEDGVQVSYVV